MYKVSKKLSIFAPVKRLLTTLLIVFLVACNKTSVVPVKPSEDEKVVGLYSGLPASGILPEVHITVSEADWEKLLKAFEADNHTQAFIPCDVSYTEGEHKQEVLGAGLRLKGNTSRRYPGKPGDLHHVHFGLHMSEYNQGAELLGTSRIDLKWFKDDPAYAREVFCFDLFRRYGIWTAIYSGYTRLWVKIGDNEEAYYGIYQLMEHIKGDYLKKRASQFGGKDGRLWKARYGADLKDPNAWMGADDNKHDYTYELKTGESDFLGAKAQLQTFIRNLNNLSGEEFFKWAESVMDVELLLRTYAVNVAVGMWDDYWNNHNNYYFYFNPDGKFFFIPYDYDNTLGTSLACGNQSDAGRQNPLQWGVSDYPLITKLLQRREWKNYYISCLHEICNGPMQASASMERIQAWHKVIGPYVSNDTGEDMVIRDAPAGWGNHGEYRILSAGKNNFFSVKAESISKL